MNTLIEIKNLTKKYYSKVALENFTMNFESGKIYGMLGPNGSGKTTLMKVIAGLHKANGGETIINGQPLSYKTKAFVAFMPTENYFPDNYKVKTVINYFADMYKDFDKEKATALIQKLGIDSNVKIKSLSTGLLAKLKVALTTSRNALIYMYDEPLNGLDILAREVIIDTIISTSSEEKIIIISSHIVDEIEKLFDNVVFIKEAHLELEGNAEELRTQKQMSIENIYKEIYR